MALFRTISFKAKIAKAGINPFVAVGAELAAKIRPGWRKPLPILVRVNGEPSGRPWRINLMPVGNGDFRRAICS
jgi:hypothetical protein